MTIAIDAPHARAVARYQHVSAYKVRQVLDLIRGLSCDDAERVLQLCQKDAADDVMKVLISAMSNAEKNNELPPDELYVAVAFADEGPTRKWGQPRARGRYFRVRKRTSHITIYVARFDEDELEERRRKEEASGRGAAVQQRRRAERVRRSRKAAAPEHDHDHDHDHDHAEEPAVASDEVVEEIEELEEEIEAGEAEIDEDGAEDDTDADAEEDDK